MIDDQAKIVQFPLLYGKVIGGFSWGKENMSTNAAMDTDGQAQERVTKFLDTLGMPKKIVRMMAAAIHGPKGIDSILEVTPEIFAAFVQNNEVTTPVEFIYTKDPSFTLIEKPADCLACIVSAKNRDGQKIVGVGHWGRKGADDLTPHKAIRWLLHNEGCQPEDIYIGMAPTIGVKHHTLTKNEIFDDVPSKLSGWKNWEEFLVGPIKTDGKEIYHIDLLGRIKNLLVSAGVHEGRMMIAAALLP